jgi:hypothetical protein
MKIVRRKEQIKNRKIKFSPDRNESKPEKLDVMPCGFFISKHLSAFPFPINSGK